MSEQIGLINIRAGIAYHYEAQNVVCYRGDGAHTTVWIPEGKAVVSLTPAFEYSLSDGDDGTRFVIFANAIPFGQIVEIALKDEA